MLFLNDPRNLVRTARDTRLARIVTLALLCACRCSAAPVYAADASAGVAGPTNSSTCSDGGPGAAACNVTFQNGSATMTGNAFAFVNPGVIDFGGDIVFTNMTSQDFDFSLGRSLGIAGAGRMQETFTYGVPISTLLSGFAVVSVSGNYSAKENGGIAFHLQQVFTAGLTVQTNTGIRSCVPSYQETVIEDITYFSGNCRVEYTFHSAGDVVMTMEGRFAQFMFFHDDVARTGFFSFNDPFRISELGLFASDGAPLDVSLFQTASGASVTPNGLVTTSAVPESSSVALVAIGMLGLLLRRTKPDQRSL